MSLFSKKLHVPNEAVKQMSELLFISKGKAKKMLLDGKYGAADILDVRTEPKKINPLTPVLNEEGMLSWLGLAILREGHNFLKEGHNCMFSMPKVVVVKDYSGNVQAVLWQGKLLVIEAKPVKAIVPPVNADSFSIN